LETTQLIIIGVIAFFVIDAIVLILFFKYRSQQGQSSSSAAASMSEAELAALPTSGPVPIQNADLEKMLRDLLAKQESARRFFKPYGDGLAFDFSSVSDPQQREQLYRSLHQINRTGKLPKGEIVKLTFSLMKASREA
jgi:hypothetical protein